ncbi:MAG: glycoside hydrolase family 16 protein [Bacteroidota bacterium]
MHFSHNSPLVIRTVSLLLPLIVAACQTSSTTPNHSGAVDEARKLVWWDEFDDFGPLDSTKWNYDIGGHGWGNNELQFYTDRLENARREDGYLIIEARREDYADRGYTSARLITRERATWRRGRVAVRAKLPSGVGTWPAIWMLGQNIVEIGWPDCGEIDIMEHVGFAPDSIFGTVHTDAFNHVEGTDIGGHITAPDLETAFHTYHIDWHDDRIDFGMDSTLYFTFEKPTNASVAEWPFDEPHYLLLNIAVGGNWGGRNGVDTSIWPQQMVVDWVRVYE